MADHGQNRSPSNVPSSISWGVAWQSASTTSEKSKSVGSIDHDQPVFTPVSRTIAPFGIEVRPRPRELVDDLEVDGVCDQDLERRAIGHPERGDAVALRVRRGAAATANRATRPRRPPEGDPHRHRRQPGSVTLRTSLDR